MGDEEDEDGQSSMNGPQQRKKMRYNVGSAKSAYIRRKPFRDNYLRPINSVSTYTVPKYKQTKKKDEISEEHNEQKIEIEAPSQEQQQTKMITDDVTSNDENDNDKDKEDEDDDVDKEKDKLNDDDNDE